MSTKKSLHDATASDDTALPKLDHAGVPVPPNEPAHRSRWRLLKRLLVLCGVLVLLAGAWVGYKIVANGVRLFGWHGVTSLVTTRKLKGEESGRVTILLAGNSVDDPGHTGATLTDSIMLVSLDTKHKTGYLLSIPRDLYVNVPGHGYSKINEVYQDGERDKFAEAGYPAGGMGLLEKVVSERFGVTIQYYALVDYAALEQAVDAVGGISVTIASTDPRGLYDPSIDVSGTHAPLVKLPNGPATLSGRAALNLARARGHARGAYGFGMSDFARTEHQRQILLALKDTASSARTLSNPLKVGELFDALGQNIATDVRLGEANRAYRLLKTIPSNKLQSVALNTSDESTNLLTDYQTRSGQAALVPKAGLDDYSAIQAFVQKLPGEAPAVSQPR